MGCSHGAGERSDTNYRDGADFRYRTRLDASPHTYLFVAADDFSTVFDSTNTASEPLSRATPASGPTVNPNVAPQLLLADLIFDAAGNNPPATITARVSAVTSSTTLQVPAPAGGVAADAWKGKAIEVVDGVTGRVRAYGSPNDAAAGADSTLTVIRHRRHRCRQRRSASDRCRYRRRLAEGTAFVWRIKY